MTTASENPSRGLTFVLGATVVAGVSGYAIQILAAALLPDDDAYLTFSAFWSAVYLLGSAVGGIQQEVARATRPAARDADRSRGLRPFTVAATVLTAAAAAVAALLLAPAAFDGDPVVMGSALVIGLLGYLLTSVATGLFYGTHRLGAVASLIVVDAVLRGVVVVGALLLGLPLGVVALAVALPFGLAVGGVWLAVRRSVTGLYTVDVKDAQLARNAAHTVLAAAATGLMVTGLPLVFRLSLTDAGAAYVASLTLVVTLTRAPFIIPIMALQSFLTVSFRDSAAAVGPRLLRYLALAGGVGVAAAAAAWPLGPWVVSLVSGGRSSTDGFTSAFVVASAVAVGCLCITGPVLLARRRHRSYAGGWVIAAVATCLFLFLLPAEPEVRAIVALTVAPLCGLLFHLWMIGRSAPTTDASGSARPLVGLG